MQLQTSTNIKQDIDAGHIILHFNMPRTLVQNDNSHYSHCKHYFSKVDLRIIETISIVAFFFWMIRTYFINIKSTHSNFFQEKTWLHFFLDYGFTYSKSIPIFFNTNNLIRELYHIKYRRNTLQKILFFKIYDSKIH